MTLPVPRPVPPTAKPVYTSLTTWQAVLSALTLLGLWGLALLLLMGVLTGGLQSGLAGLGEGLPLMLMAASLGLAGLLMLPSVIYSSLRFFGRSAGKVIVLNQVWLPLIAITLLIPLVLGLGSLVQATSFSWLLLPVLHLLGISLPILWMMLIALRGLPLGTPQRFWGVFGAGLVLGPASIMLAELLALLGMFIMTVISVASQSDLAAKLVGLAGQLRGDELSPDAVMTLLAPYLLNPWVIFGALAFGAVIVPLTEEAMKPAGLWLLTGRRFTPAEGFAAGVVSGAGYALFESLISTSSGNEWAMLAAARMGTAAIHILATGLVGWALTQSWTDGRYLRLGFTYIAAICIHGAWNGLTLVSTFSSFAAGLPVVDNLPGWFTSLGDITPAFLIGMTISSLLVIILINARMQSPKPAAEPPVS